MIHVALLLTFLFWDGSPIGHSRYQRPIQVSAAGQNYVPVDETIWAHARGDLGDVRLFSADTEIPYSIAIERLDLTAVRNCLSACGCTRRVGTGVTPTSGSSAIHVSERAMTSSETALSCAK